MKTPVLRAGERLPNLYPSTYTSDDIKADKALRARRPRPGERSPVEARVVHPQYGQVVVPHSSNYAAILNAAEYWGCDWMRILDAEVWRAEPGDGPTVKPREFCEKR